NSATARAVSACNCPPRSRYQARAWPADWPPQQLPRSNPAPTAHRLSPTGPSADLKTGRLRYQTAAEFLRWSILSLGCELMFQQIIAGCKFIITWKHIRVHLFRFTFRLLPRIRWQKRSGIHNKVADTLLYLWFLRLYYLRICWDTLGISKVQKTTVN